eukprot:s1434_g28.t1
MVKAEPADEKQRGEAGVSELAMETREPLDAVLEDDDDDLEGRTLRFAMIDKPTSASKLHLPAVGTQKGEKTLVVPMPKCGARGNYSFVMAGDAMDPTTELCIRCFGHRLESDVAMAKDALRSFKRGGGDSGMNDREIDLLRWHGGKATLTSLMQHLELDPKMVRLAGDWAAKEDAMPDTSGGDFGFLVSGGLVGAGPPGDGDVGSVPDASHVGANQNSADDAASRAKESTLKTNARLAGLRCEYPGLPGLELCAAFLDKGFDKDGQPLAEVAEEEAKAAPMPVEEVQKLLEPNNPDDDVYVVYSFDGQEKAASMIHSSTWSKL